MEFLADWMLNDLNVWELHGRRAVPAAARPNGVGIKTSGGETRCEQ
jgi:hypothetical protein